MSKTILEINNLSKNYGKLKALNNLNLRVDNGMVFGILGPNGSGKTTTLGIILGVLHPSEGSFSWFQNGNDTENRKRIGALLETPNFYPYLDAVQNLNIVCKIKNVVDAQVQIDIALKTVGLYERRHSKFKTFSLGMKQRLAIGSALLNDPDVLVLDEPTNGLDPQGIAQIRTLIHNISLKGKTILIASHQLDEIEKICTDVVILQEGTAIKQSAIGNIVKNKRQLAIQCSDIELAKKIIEELDGAEFLEMKADLLILNIEESVTAEDVNKFFFEKGIVLSELRLLKQSLETQFLEITQK